MVRNIFVFGATGNIGSATVQALSQALEGQQDWLVQAGVRNPDSDKAKALGQLSNVSLVKVSMGDEDAQIQKALEGVNVLYIVTPGAENRTELCLNAARAGKAAGVEHILVVSVPTYSLKDTIFGKQCSEIEEGLSALQVPLTTLRLPLFVDNNWAYLSTIKDHGAFYGPTGPSKQFSPITVSDAAVAATKILSASSEELAKHAGKAYTISSDVYSNEELAKTFTEVLGKEIKYVQVDYAAAKQAFLELGFPEWQVDGIMELFHLIDDESPIIRFETSEYKELTGKQPTSIRQWVEQVSAAFQ